MSKLGLASLFVVFASVFTSFDASAGASDLLGKWAAPCNRANSAGTEFTSTLNEFKSNGTVIAGNIVYGDANCLGPAIRTEQADEGSYSASDTTIQLNASVRGKSFQYTLEYTVSGNVLTLSCTQFLVDGQPQPVTPAPTALTRVQ